MKLFPEPGQKNTSETLALAKSRAKELGIKEIVLSSTTGETAKEALNVIGEENGLNLIVVTHHCGFKEPFKSEMDDRTKREIEEAGAKLLHASHVLTGIERSFRAKYGGVYPAEIVAVSLRMFGEGVKVCVEVSVMAADAGLLSGDDVIALGGTSKGVDTACVIKPAHMNNLFDLHVKEIICKPET